MPEDEHTTRNSGRDVELSTEIATTVADAAGVDPLDLDPLYDVVDPEVVETLLETPSVSPESSIRFTYAGFEVTVEGEGDISVEESTE